MKKWIGVLQIILAGLGFGFLGIFGRWAFQENLSVGELLFWRFVFASAILWGMALTLKRHWLRLSLSQILTSMALGLFGYAVFSTLYFEAIKGVSVALAAMLLFTFPIFVSLGSHFILKERMSTIQWLSLFIAFSGMALLLWGDISVQSAKALLMGLGAAISYSIYVLISGRVQKNVSPLSSSLFVITSAAIGLYIFHRPDLGRLMHFSPKQFSIVMGIAIFCSILPMSLFLAGLQKMKSSQASILVMIEPVVATSAAWLLLGEALNSRQLMGACMVLSALVLNAISK